MHAGDSRLPSCWQKVFIGSGSKDVEFIYTTNYMLYGKIMWWGKWDIGIWKLKKSNLPNLELQLTSVETEM